MMFVANVADVDTCSVYEAAPLTEFHVSVGLIDTPLAPFDGDTRVGIEGSVPIVVNDQLALKALQPPELPALTRQ